MHLGGIDFISDQAKRTRNKTKGAHLQHAVVQCSWRVDVMSGKVDVAAAFFSCERCITSIGFGVVRPSAVSVCPIRIRSHGLDFVDCGIVFGSLCI